MTGQPLSARRPGASELIKELGLLVDGPTQWERPVPSRAPGIFVIELPSALADAPIDIVAVRRWLEHVPAMTLDGETPAPADVARRLHEFWLPNEPVLFVGRSAKSVGSRLAAMYATPLGDSRPHSGGHWLRTLSVLPELRVWWAETDAHEEYEDALLSAIAERNAAPGRDLASGGLLPFANMMTPDGISKAHGLGNSLRAANEPSTAPVAKPSRKASTQRQPRKAPPPRDAPLRPTAAPTYLSHEGLDQLTAELDDLRTRQRPVIIARVAAARELGDLRENADYEYARKEQSFIEGRILAVEQMLRTGVVIERDESLDVIHLGSTVEVETDGDHSIYVIVGSTEAKPASGRLSNESPVGRALLGAREGDEVVVDLPTGSTTYRVIAVH
ncbi:MAG TPA: transcription elongation factor GreA [Candidatus Limnocylindrales bacterium]